MGVSIVAGVMLVTACGNKKEKIALPAGKLYKSPRIRYLYKKAKELNIPFYILSAKYGLINSEQVIEPYDKIMTQERIYELLENVKEVIRDFDVVVFYQGGARREYRELIELACNELGKTLIKYGYKNMGDIGKTEDIINKLLGEAK